MRIRFLNTHEPVTSLYRDLAPQLARRGAQIEVLLSAAEYRPGRSRLEAVLSWPNIRVVHLSSGGVLPHNRLRKGWIMLTYVLGVALHTLIGPSVDLNFFLTQPPLFSLWGLVLKRLRRQPYACLIMDVYPDVAIMDGVLKGNSILARLLNWLSKIALRRAELIIVIGRCMAEQIMAKGVDQTRIHIIPNWSNEEYVAPFDSARNTLRQELGLQDKFVVLYSGNMGTSHYFDDVLETARRLRQLEQLVFVFIGDGRRRKEIERAVISHNLGNIALLPFQPMERLAESLSMGDVHFVSLRSGFEGLVVPSKAYGALAVGRPLVFQGDPRSEIARMIAEEGIGQIVPLANPDRLEDVVVGYLRDPQLAVQQGQKALALARDRYSSARALEAYTQLLLERREMR